MVSYIFQSGSTLPSENNIFLGLGSTFLIEKTKNFILEIWTLLRMPLNYIQRFSVWVNFANWKNVFFIQKLIPTENNTFVIKQNWPWNVFIHFSVRFNYADWKNYYLHSRSTFPTEKRNIFIRYIWTLLKVELNFIHRYFSTSQFCLLEKDFFIGKLDPDLKLYFVYSAKLTLKCFHTIFIQGWFCNPKKIIFTVRINLSD